MASERLSGKCAIVTGAASGLGRGIAHRFVEEGANVIITDINEAAGTEVAAAISARFVPQDVTVETHWIDLFAQLAKDGIRVDILVNNAGFADAGLGIPLEDVDIVASRRVFEVNVHGTLMGCKHAIRNMKSRGGSIINMSSVGALVPVPFIAAYGAAKAAVRHLSQSVALYCAEQGYAIRCNSIHPGQIRTPMHDQLVAATADSLNISATEAEAGFRSRIPMGEFGQVEDVAAAALYLASDESHHVTGDRMLVDGGMMLTN